MPRFREQPQQIYRTVRSQLQQLIGSLSGQDRKDNQRLQRKLRALRTDNEQLIEEVAELNRQASASAQTIAALHQDLTRANARLSKVEQERSYLRKAKSQLEHERDDLELEVLDLKQQLATLKQEMRDLQDWAVQSDSHGPDDDTPAEAEAAEGEEDYSSVDLSHLKLALVGGHDTTRREVIRELSQGHGLETWVELPPSEQHSIGRSKIRSKIHDCDLIVIITTYISHKQTDAISGLKQAGAITGEVLPLNQRGKSGVVREILAHVAQR